MNGGIIILLRELCLLFDTLICFGIPIAGVLILSKKVGKALKPFLKGMVAFTVSQLILRIPIISIVLPNFTWYQLLQLNLYPYGIFLGMTAGIFEETARLIFMKLFLKNRTRLGDGLAFGLGHGGIEAMVLVGVNCIATMIMYPMGYFDLSDTGCMTLLVGGFERIFAIAFHVGASLIVLYGIRTNRILRFTALAILLHAYIDSSVVILPKAFGVGIYNLEIYIMIVSSLVLIYGCWLFVHKHNNKGAII
jgi:uncharacterized membrane protein YhfC